MKSLAIIILGCVYMFGKSEIFPPFTTSILGLTKTVIHSGWDLIENRSVVNLSKPVSYKQRNILQRITMLDKNITYASQMIANVRLDTMSDVVTYLAKTAKVDIKFNDLVQHIDDIDHAYRRMLSYATNKNGVNRSNLEDFAQNVVISHHASSVKMHMEKIHGFIAIKTNKSGHSSLLDVLTTTKDLDQNAMCISMQSPNQLIYNLYNVISLTQLKAYIMIQLSYILLEIYEKGPYIGEFQETRNEFVNRSIEFAGVIKTALNSTSRHFWLCDSYAYQSGVNYLEITQLIQGYIQNEETLNRGGTCREDCSYYKQTKSYNCLQDQYCRKQRECRGNILNCQSVESPMRICPANPNSGRRYSYIELGNGSRTLGRKQYCPRTNEVQIWSYDIFWECSYCICLCDDESIYSDRYFSLRFAVSNVLQNMVVTGMRFMKKNRIIHLQVQQGQLLPQGVINGSSVQWVPVSNFRKSDRSVYNREDYFRLNWKERAIDLDVLEGKEGHVLTGIRFLVLASHLHFEIRVTPFDFETGKLRYSGNTRESIYDLNTVYTKRTEIRLENVDVPIRTTSPSKIISNKNEFIQFTHTDFDKDVAQTTVPFIDSQDVVPDVPMPISGAGLYFKSTEGFGGFIGLKLITYNFSKHLDFAINQNN